MRGIEVDRGLRVPTRDATVLRAELWHPVQDAGDGGADRALVVVRTPYDPRGLRRVVRALTAAGHPVLVASCRGTFGSGGVFTPFVDEEADGEDLLAWVAEQPWGQGPVALVGASYTGHTAHALLTGPGGAGRVVAAALAVTATDFHRAVMHPHGAFGLETALVWSFSLTHQELPLLRRLAALAGWSRRRARALRTAPPGTDPARADVVAVGQPYPPYRRWWEHDVQHDPMWAAADRSAALAVMPPSVRVAGWYDPFLVEQLADHTDLVARGSTARLVVGPWTHGSRDVERTVVREGLRLLAEPDAAAGVLVHDAGAGRWVALPSWPPPSRRHELRLGVGGHWSGSPPDGPVELTWRHDPADPPPAAGGRALDPGFAGRRRQHRREQRDDVLVTSGDRLPAPLVVAGTPEVTLLVPAATQVQDVAVRLCDVDRAGVSRNVCDGFVRLGGPAADEPDEPDRPRAVVVRLAPTVHTFRRGHRLRLQVSSTGHPTHPVLPGPAQVRSVLSAPGAPSTLVLPVVDGGWVPATTPGTTPPGG